ncbi:MAG TPA: hypothetical protein VL693_19120 [Vicinamibacterales bacterium]|nr:hypothetical protein [Vicinamibacterales bacterium]
MRDRSNQRRGDDDERGRPSHDAPVTNALRLGRALPPRGVHRILNFNARRPGVAQTIGAILSQTSSQQEFNTARRGVRQNGEIWFTRENGRQCFRDVGRAKWRNGRQYFV